ncbi:MAG: hypothetical protein ACI825_001774 [Planctomycetota bacterium]|jgi:hypothetical protein|uniref:DNA topoisomerase IV n=1 Tax=Patiriisocius sp. Uisw_047 TaxID=3230969 RepID=UPI0039E9CA80
MKFIYVFFSFLLLSCYQPERNCTNFKTGTFEFETLIGTEVVKTTFVRNDSLEIDFYRGKADTSSVRWLNDCEFIVKHVNPKNMAEKKALHMKILTTDGDQYLFEYNIVGETRKEKGTARKITE